MVSHVHRTLLFALTVLVSTSRPAAAAHCDPHGADAAALAAAWTAVDAACPCAGATSPSVYRACGVGVLQARYVAGLLPSGCRRRAQQRVTRSTCGRPGAVVCCLINARGRGRGRIVGDPALCLAPEGGVACVADASNVVEGCPAPACAVCVPPPPAGETLLACLAQSGTQIAVAAGGTGYLAAWAQGVDGTRSEVVGRRLDSSAAPIDVEPITLAVPLPVVEIPDDTFSNGGPRLAGDANGWYVGWAAAAMSAPVNAVRGARVDADGTVRGAHTLASALSFGQCRSGVSGPLDVASDGGGTFAVLWMAPFGCVNGPIFYPHVASRVTFAGDSATLSGGGRLDPVALPQPPVLSGTGGGIASGGGESVAVVFQTYADWATFPPMLVDHTVSALWLPPTSGPTDTRLATGPQSTSRAPAVAWGATSFLAAWSAVPPTGSTETEMRAVRFTRRNGPLDPDVGLLIAAGVAPAASPVVAFDGTAWMVAWLDAGAGGTFDVLGVGVRGDGTVVDPTPRLLAADVMNVAPSLTGRDAGGFVLGVVRAARAGRLAVTVRPVPAP